MGPINMGPRSARVLGVWLLAGLTFGCGGGINSSSGPGTTSATATAPAAPTALAATAGNQQVTLTWTASSGATSYHVKRATASGGPYTQVASATSASYTDTGLTNGTMYFYVVSALNASGESTNSSPASSIPVSPAPGSSVPAAPTALSAIAGNQQISLSWTASGGVTSYHVKRAAVSGGPYAQVSAPTGNNYLDTGLANGTTYYYVVSALNAIGESTNSSQASATPAAAAAPDVTITVDPTKTKVISPWIYGLNFYTGISGAPPHLTLDRAGGNRWSDYWTKVFPRIADKAVARYCRRTHMRIDLNNVLLNSVEREDKTRKTASKAPSAPSVEDKASLSVDTLSVSSLETQTMAAPAVRQDKIDALRQAIQNGEYKVEPDKVAQAILEHNKR